MELRKLSETSTTITLGWDQVPNAEWFLFYAKGARVSNAPAKDSNGVPKTSIKFSKGGEPYEVVAITRTGTGAYDTDVGVWTGTPIPGDIVPEPPRGPFTVRDGGGTTASFGDCWSTTAVPFTVRNKHVKNVTFSGVGSQQQWQNGLPIENPGRTLIEDCIVENVSRPAPGASGGTGEANAWLGNPTTMRRCQLLGPSGWMLMNLVGRSHDSVIEDVLFDGKNAVAVGAYLEHNTHRVTFRRCSFKGFVPRPVAGGSEPLGILAARSTTGEWAYNDPIYGGRVCPHTVDFEDCDIYCPPRDPRFENGPTGFDPSCGSYWGPGCHTIRYLGATRFWGPGWGIYAPTVRLGPDVYIAPTVRFENSGPRLTYHSLPMG